jgi:hypothetical protein
LATSGQLSAEESDRLNQHLVECDDCRSFLKEAQFLSDRIIPQALPASRVAMRTPDGMRERFLACAAKAGMTMQAGPALAGQVPIVESDQVRQEVAPGRRFLLPRWIASSLRPTPAWALAGIACVACFVLGRVTGNPFNPPAHSGSNGINVQVSAPQAVPGISPANTDSLRARALTGERDRLAKQVADLSLELEAEQKENQQVESSLEQKFTASVSDAARDYDALKQQSAALNTRAVELESELAGSASKSLWPRRTLRAPARKRPSTLHGSIFCRPSCAIRTRLRCRILKRSAVWWPPAIFTSSMFTIRAPAGSASAPSAGCSMSKAGRWYFMPTTSMPAKRKRTSPSISGAKRQAAKRPR